MAKVCSCDREERHGFVQVWQSKSVFQLEKQRLQLHMRRNCRTVKVGEGKESSKEVMDAGMTGSGVDMVEEMGEEATEMIEGAIEMIGEEEVVVGPEMTEAEEELDQEIGHVHHAAITALQGKMCAIVVVQPSRIKQAEHRQVETEEIDHLLVAEEVEEIVVMEIGIVRVAICALVGETHATDVVLPSQEVHQEPVRIDMMIEEVETIEGVTVVVITDITTITETEADHQGGIRVLAMTMLLEKDNRCKICVRLLHVML